MKFKRILIIAVFIFILIPVSTYAESKTYNSYLALGDSITAGHALKNTQDGYSYILKNALHIKNENFDNLAISGMTAKEFNEIIRTDKYTEKIKTADIITISIGANEILGTIKNSFLEISGITAEQTRDLDSFNNAMMEKVSIKDKKDLKSLYSMITRLYERLSSDEIDSKLMEQIKQYKISWKNSIDYIKTINPNVTIIATEFYNPFYNFVMLYDWGEFAEKYIIEFNKYQYELSNNEINYKIAKIYNDFNVDSPRITNVSTDFSAFSIDPHPNKEGHKIIANEILKILGIEQQEEMTNENMSKDIVQNQNNLIIIPVICGIITVLILVFIIVFIFKKKKK